MENGFHRRVAHRARHDSHGDAVPAGRQPEQLPVAVMQRNENDALAAGVDLSEELQVVRVDVGDLRQRVCVKSWCPEVSKYCGGEILERNAGDPFFFLVRFRFAEGSVKVGEGNPPLLSQDVIRKPARCVRDSVHSPVGQPRKNPRQCANSGGFDNVSKSFPSFPLVDIGFHEVADYNPQRNKGKILPD
jgi:hypothetical protein